MVLIDQIKNSFLHLVFPHVCEGCGSDVVDDHELLCLKCLGSLPKTGFQFHSSNIVEKMFWGRLPIREASAQYYFTKESLMQKLMHQVSECFIPVGSIIPSSYNINSPTASIVWGVFASATSGRIKRGVN